MGRVWDHSRQLPFLPRVSASYPLAAAQHMRAVPTGACLLAGTCCGRENVRDGPLERKCEVWIASTLDPRCKPRYPCTKTALRELDMISQSDTTDCRQTRSAAAGKRRSVGIGETDHKKNLQSGRRIPTRGPTRPRPVDNKQRVTFTHQSSFAPLFSWPATLYASNLWSPAARMPHKHTRRDKDDSTWVHILPTICA